MCPVKTMTTEKPRAQRPKPLRRKRILFRGKWASGKSTLLVLAVAALQDESYEVTVLDGDA